MKKKIVKRILKITGIILLIFVGVIAVQFYRFSTPKTDAQVVRRLQGADIDTSITYNTFEGFTYRVVASQKVVDTILPTIVFVHGTPGSALDFRRYMTDSSLISKANMFSYDRIGYGRLQKGEVQESIAFETSLLESFISSLNVENVVLVGYSYGGPIALASKLKYKKIVLLAPAVSSEYESIPWGVNLYKWRFTRWMLPKIWKAASKEKLSHQEDLRSFEDNWGQNNSSVVSIHGKKDWIVPYENSLFLKEELRSHQYEIVTLDKAGHGLVWTRFEQIKQELLKHLK